MMGVTISGSSGNLWARPPKGVKGGSSGSFCPLPGNLFAIGAGGGGAEDRMGIGAVAPPGAGGGPPP